LFLAKLIQKGASGSPKGPAEWGREGGETEKKEGGGRGEEGQTRDELP